MLSTGPFSTNIVVVLLALAAALGAGALTARRRASGTTRKLWGPLGVALLTGWMVWIMASGLLFLSQRAQVDIPDVTLIRLDGGTVKLAQLTGQPMVVNLWATWCPPCRREMPMLAAAQQRYPRVNFVFVNQREGPAAVRDYLRDRNLHLTHVLLDTQGAIAQSVGTHALPTTLFYDARGRLVDSHIGMLTPASLAAALEQFDLPAATATSNLDRAETTSGA